MSEERRTYVGRVTGKGAVLARVAMRIDGERTERVLGDQLTIALDDGGTVTVSARPDSLDIPRTERRGGWNDVADSPLAEVFANERPGEHLTLELAGWVIDGGARIAVRVDGVARSVVRVEGDDAAAIAALDAADAELARRQTREAARPQQQPRRAPNKQRAAPVPWRTTTRVLGALGLGLVALGEVVPPFLPIGALLLASALSLALSVPPFLVVESSTDLPKKPAWQVGTLVTWLIAGGVVAVPVTLIAGIQLAYAYTAISSVVLALVLARRHRSARRLASLLLTGPRLESGDGAGRFEGTVVAAGRVITATDEYLEQIEDRSYDRYESRPTVVAGHTTGKAAGWQRHEDFAYSIEAVRKSTPPADFTIRRGDQEVRVTGDRALWGASFEFLPVPTYKEFAKRKERAMAEAGERGDSKAWNALMKEARPIYATKAEISDGDSVIVRARVTDNVIDARGREALVMFAAPADAARTLRGLVWRWRAKLLLIAAIAAGCAFGAVRPVLESPDEPPAARGPAERP